MSDTILCLLPQKAERYPVWTTEYTRPSEIVEEEEEEEIEKEEEEEEEERGRTRGSLESEETAVESTFRLRES